jgi:hypothetical protein
MTREGAERRRVTLAVEDREFAAAAAEAASLFEHPAAELSLDDSAQLCEDRRRPDHIA